MTRLTQEQIAEAWDATHPDWLRAWRFQTEHTNEAFTAFASRIAALAVQEVERERDGVQAALNAVMDNRQLLKAEIATLTAQLAEARDEIAGFEAMWEQREKAHDAETEALRALLAAYQSVRSENARLRRALQEIADTDYRGNRSHESTLAYHALARTGGTE